MLTDEGLTKKIKLDIATYTDGLIGLDDITNHIIELVRGSEWVSVDERLPEEKTDVLCTQYAYMDENKGRYQMVGFRIDDEWFSSSIDDEPESCFTPTHWMPLPSPPTNKGE